MPFKSIAACIFCQTLYSSCQRSFTNQSYSVISKLYSKFKWYPDHAVQSWTGLTDHIYQFSRTQLLLNVLRRRTLFRGVTIDLLVPRAEFTWIEECEQVLYIPISESCWCMLSYKCNIHDYVYFTVMRIYNCITVKRFAFPENTLSFS